MFNSSLGSLVRNDIQTHEFKEAIERLREELDQIKQQMGRNIGSNTYNTKNFAFNSNENPFVSMIPFPIYLIKYIYANLDQMMMLIMILIHLPLPSYS
jgi:hypothetical protein